MLFLFDFNCFIYFLDNNQAFLFGWRGSFLITILHSRPQRHIVLFYERSILLTLFSLLFILMKLDGHLVRRIAIDVSCSLLFGCLQFCSSLLGYLLLQKLEIYAISHVLSSSFLRYQLLIFLFDLVNQSIHEVFIKIIFTFSYCRHLALSYLSTIWIFKVGLTPKQRCEHSLIRRLSEQHGILFIF